MLEIPKEVIDQVMSALINAHIFIDESKNYALGQQVDQAITALADAEQDATATEA